MIVLSTLLPLKQWESWSQEKFRTDLLAFQLNAQNWSYLGSIYLCSRCFKRSFYMLHLLETEVADLSQVFELNTQIEHLKKFGAPVL